MSMDLAFLPYGQSELPRARWSVASRGLVGHTHDTIGMMACSGVVGHGRLVHTARCLPSHLPHVGECLESRHISIQFLQAFLGDVDGRIPVGVVLSPTRHAFESLLVPVCTSRMLTLGERTRLTRIFRVDFVGRDALERGLVRDELSKFAERETVEATVHPGAIVDTVPHLFEVFEDDDRLLEP